MNYMTKVSNGEREGGECMHTDKSSGKCWKLTFHIFAFALSEERNGNFDIIFECKCFERLFDGC